MLKEVCAALLEADVNIKLVKQLRENVKYVTRVFVFLMVNSLLQIACSLYNHSMISGQPLIWRRWPLG